MSRDHSKVVEAVANVETKTETSNQSAEKISADERRKIAMERRKTSVSVGVRGPIRILGHDKYVPAGFVSGYYPQSFADRLFSKGYDFVRDDQGNVCTCPGNKGKDAPEHNFVMMMAPEEIVLDDQRLDAERALQAAKPQKVKASDYIDYIDDDS